MKTLHRPSRGFSLLEIVIVVTLLGFLLSYAVPALQKARVRSQDEAVLNNARRLAQAADQHFLESGVTSVAASQLVGSDRYVKALATVAGETYPTHYTMGVTITVNGVGGMRTVTYAP